MKSASLSKKHPDLIVVGAGIFGLWAARHALLRGERVLVLEKRFVGAGASGGFLGSLMPHMPDSWNAKKQMQFDGLATIGEAIAALECDTGLDCGFRRCGRLMPMTHEKMVAHARARVAGAGENWRAEDGASFSMEYLKPGFEGTIAEGWLEERAAPFGATYDTLSARVNPRAYLQALAAYVRSESHGRGDIIEGAEVTAFSGARDGAQVRLADSTFHSAGQVIIANGFEAYGLLGSERAKTGGQLITGRGVKGQAVLLEYSHDDNRPILYDNGSYIVPHGIAMGAGGDGRANRIAIGSTSVNDWLPASHPEVENSNNGGEWVDASGQQSASADLLSVGIENRQVPKDQGFESARTGFDEADTGFLDHARAICPSIRQAPIAERWANIRPRNTIPDPETGKTGTEPVFAQLEGQERVSVAVGGFKISFGLGHLGGITTLLSIPNKYDSNFLREVR